MKLPVCGVDVASDCQPLDACAGSKPGVSQMEALLITPLRALMVSILPSLAAFLFFGFSLMPAALPPACQGRNAFKCTDFGKLAMSDTLTDMPQPLSSAESL